MTGKKLNKARTTVYAKGCKAQVRYLKSKKATNTVLSQSRKAGKKLGYRAVVKLTVATKTKAPNEGPEPTDLSTYRRARPPTAAGPFACPPTIDRGADSSAGRAGDF